MLWDGFQSVADRMRFRRSVETRPVFIETIRKESACLRLPSHGHGRSVSTCPCLMVERGYDAIVVRDEANLRWLTGVKGVFDYTFEFPHAAFITADQCLFHTDSRYLNSFEENTPAGSPWVYDMDEGTIPRLGRRQNRGQQVPRLRCRGRHADQLLSGYSAWSGGSFRRLHAAADACRHSQDARHQDAEEIELMRHAQSITDAAFQHMLGFIKLV